MFITGLPHSTPLHHLDVRVKILGFLVIVVLTLLFENPFFNLGIVLLLFGIVIAVRFPFKISVFLPLLPLFLFMTLFNCLACSPKRFHLEVYQATLCYLLPGERWGMTLGGIMLSVTFLLRIFTMVTASMVLTAVSSLEEWIQLLQKLKIPYEVSFIITTAIRFVPTLDRKRKLILDARKARGADFGAKGILHWLRAQITVMVPLMMHAIFMAEALSMSMLNRGFGYARTRTNFRKLSLTTADYWALLVISLAMTCGLYLRIGLHLGGL